MRELKVYVKIVVSLLCFAICKQDIKSRNISDILKCMGKK